MFIKALSSLVLISLLVACATKPLPVGVGTEVSAQFKAPTKGETIIILPTISAFREFEVGEEPVTAALNQELIAAGYKTYLYPKSDLIKFWETETALLGKRIGPQIGQNYPQLKELINAKLAVKLNKDLPNSLVLNPVIVSRRAELSGAYAQWDGRKSMPPTSSNNSDGKWGGSTQAISLELIALDADGKQQFKTYGGLLLPYRTNVVSAKVEMREDMFKKKSEYADGVKIALNPLLPNTVK